MSFIEYFFMPSIIVVTIIIINEYKIHKKKAK